MWFLLLCLIGCRGVYHQDDKLTEVEFTPCASQYSLGIAKATNSSAILLVFQDGMITGHGSTNYFYSGKHKFFITAAHSLVRGNGYLIEEEGGNRVKAKVVYVELSSDVAILSPEGELKNTKPVLMSHNRSSSLVGHRVYYMGSPGQLRYALAEGFVMWTNKDTAIIQSFGWFGASGSVVFDKGGRIVGVLQGVYVDQHGLFEDVIEDVVYVQRIDFLSRKKIREIFDNAAEVQSGNSD